MPKDEERMKFYESLCIQDNQFEQLKIDISVRSQNNDWKLVNEIEQLLLAVWFSSMVILETVDCIAIGYAGHPIPQGKREYCEKAVQAYAQNMHICRKVMEWMRSVQKLHAITVNDAQCKTWMSQLVAQRAKQCGLESFLSAFENHLNYKMNSLQHWYFAEETSVSLGVLRNNKNQTTASINSAMSEQYKEYVKCMEEDNKVDMKRKMFE